MSSNAQGSPSRQRIICFKMSVGLGVVACACNPNTQEAEAGGS
jgi:hypothetical protein